MVDFLLSGIVVMALFYIVKRNSEKESVKQQNEDTFIAVSYTHLTLPTMAVV